MNALSPLDPRLSLIAFDEGAGYLIGDGGEVIETYPTYLYAFGGKYLLYYNVPNIGERADILDFAAALQEYQELPHKLKPIIE